MTTSIFKKSRKLISEHALKLSLSFYLLIESNPAFAFAQVYVPKISQFTTHLITIGQYTAAASLAWALIKFLFNVGGNWKYIGTVAGVGISLMGVGTLFQFIGATR